MRDHFHLQGLLDTIEVYQIPDNRWSFLPGAKLPMPSTTIGTTLKPLNVGLIWVGIVNSAENFLVFDMDSKTWDTSHSVPNIETGPQGKVYFLCQ